MPRFDAHGNPTTAASAVAVERLDGALDGLLHFQGGMVTGLEGALEADPDLALAHALKGYLGVLGGEAEGARAARASLDAYLARADRARLLERERRHLAAADALLRGDLHGAGERLYQLSLENPRDLLAVAVGHHIDFFTGDAAMLHDRPAAALAAWSPEERPRANLLGMLAFGLEETGRYDEAEAVGLEAVARDPKDVWAIHAVAHTYEMQGRFAEGALFYDERLADWSAGNFFTVHNWWHYALYLLEAGEDDRALEVHDAALLGPDASGLSLQLQNATALCWRLLLEGRLERERFSRQAALWAPKVEPAFSAFNDMHVVMAFVGAGLEPEAEALIAARERWLANSPEGAVSNARMTRDVGLPVCRALLAFGRGQYDRAVEHLLPVRHRLHEFGGSHAQRDAVLRTLLEASIRSGRHGLAEALVGERLEARPRSPYNWLKQAEVLDRQGLAARATLARGEAARRRAEASLGGSRPAG